MKLLKTPRLILDPLTVDSADAMFDGLRDERLYDYISDRPYGDVEALKDRYRRLEKRKSPDGSQQWLNWVMKSAETGQSLGYMQATIDGGAAEIAYVLFVEAWGQGLAAEAVRAMIEHLQGEWFVKRVTATCDPQSARSIALLERLGFTGTRLRRAAAEIRGEVRDEADYALWLDGECPGSHPIT